MRYAFTANVAKVLLKNSTDAKFAREKSQCSLRSSYDSIFLFIIQLNETVAWLNGDEISSLSVCVRRHIINFIYIYTSECS